MTTTEMSECPICFESLDLQVNCLTTECGHKFHGNCFMLHTAHNGYSCPCCRYQMIEEPSDDDDDDDDEESLGSQDTREYNYGEMDFVPDEDEVLYSYRWFHQRLNDEELEEDKKFLTVPEMESQDDMIFDENKEQVQNLVKRMMEINKLSYEKLLAAYMHKNCKDFKYNYYAEEMSFDVTHMINDIHEKLLTTQRNRDDN